MTDNSFHTSWQLRTVSVVLVLILGAAAVTVAYW